MGLRADDIMQHDVHTVRADATLVELERTFSAAKQSGFPVVDEKGQLVGVVSRTDVVRKLATEQSWAEYQSAYYWDPVEADDEPLEQVAARVGARLERARVSDVMSHEPLTVTRSTPLEQVAVTLWERGIHRLPVVDAGELVGIVTTMDLVRLVADGRIG